ncbi:transposase [Desulfonema magnum]|uniref:Transposase domain-containing protein, DUF772 n=1 Tax=Desulfonema magnum TaxID=45655 RepID=A0A975GQB7_9BACT|nr:transposase [Desulfonema magnum]QTA89861.1 Transposase domain-containing protein, DUF772 [Desulfonema magnum]
MIEKKFEEAFTPEWVKKNITDLTNELVILRKVIPWQKIINRLTRFYDSGRGCVGISLRTVIGLFVVVRLRLLSDRGVVSQVRENRYIQYFCNVPDEKLKTFIHDSGLCKIRRRPGEEGIAVIESEIFDMLRLAGVIKGDCMLTDSTVLPADIIYPTDIGLIFKAFGKMRHFAETHGIPLWWDDREIKELWREYNLNRNKNEIPAYFFEFALIFVSALRTFGDRVGNLTASGGEKEKALRLLALLTLLNEKNEQKIAGERHIKNRTVSLDEPEARPIKKGKKHPDCEFGTTLQMSFNRQGFMVTVENFIGKPDDSTLWPATSELFIKRMGEIPEFAIGDQGYRSVANLSIPGGTEHIFLGRSSDVAEEKKDFCRKARSATEGFIAVAKNIRGFGRSLYRGFGGDRIWSLLCQTACNLKKFLQLYFTDEIGDESLKTLGLA